MTRFAFIADTHLGATAEGFQQQRKYPDKLPEIVDALKRRLQVDPAIDFVLHGGDMIEATSDAAIRAAADLFRLPVPVYLCLGNHDLTTPGAAERWMELTPDFFPGHRPEFTVSTDDCLIHVVPNHWGDASYCWSDSQDARLSEDQLEQLNRDLQVRPDLPHIILTHSPVFPVPVEQTGLEEPFHPPIASFTGIFKDLAARHPTLQCVLGAHSHVNMRVRHGGVDHVTVSSLIETPFEFKIFDVSPNSMSMATIQLAGDLDFTGEYDALKSFVQGQPAHRSFQKSCRVGTDR